ncbi:OmpA family protein [Acetobacteraceae bacterium AT-5844]|nr:OmpA family protein [Acetobacteraceae bacterium AT-5844]
MRFLPATFLLLGLAACQAPTGFSAEQIAALRGNGFQPVDENWELGMADRLLFATDESRLDPVQEQNIGRMTGTLVGVGVRGARVEGHTDDTGAADYNEQLSLRRAGAVKQAMVRGGMDDSAVHAIGRGSRAPVETNRTAAGRRENRRVVIIVSPADAMPLPR